MKRKFVGQLEYGFGCCTTLFGAKEVVCIFFLAAGGLYIYIYIEKLKRPLK
jgi:hypothetical protein